MARGPGVAPGRDHAAVPGHDRPRHAAPGERREERGRCVSVSVESADTALGETAELSVEEQCHVSVIHPR